MKVSLEQEKERSKDNWCAGCSCSDTTCEAGATEGGRMTPIKQRRYWREEMKAAKKAMELYPVGSDEREIYRAKYNEAAKRKV